MSKDVEVIMNYDILEKVREIGDFVSNLADRRDFLHSQLAVADREICDIQHAAEFFNMSASQGYKLYKMLHDVCVRRRKYKDEIQKIDLVLGNIDKSSVNVLEKKLVKVGNKTYSPRVLKELFES